MGSGLSEKKETRYTPAEETRLSEDKNKLTGYAAVFNSYSQDLGGFKERIRQGAFKKTLADGADVRALFNHDQNYILGRTKAGTLTLLENNKGLKYDLDLPNTTYANDLKESVSRGDVTQNSFGFYVVQDEWSKDFSKREIIEAKLVDISPVTFPAYPQTSLKLRDLFNDIGIDYYTLNLIMQKKNRNIELIDSDIEIINDTIKILNDFLPTVEPEETHSPGEPDISTLIRAKRIEVEAKMALINN